MKPPSKPPFVARIPHLAAVILLIAVAGTADARPKKKDEKPPTLDFTGIQFEGQIHTPQLLYFLDRASQELERASLERRSFIAEMVKSVDEDDL